MGAVHRDDPPGVLPVCTLWINTHTLRTCSWRMDSNVRAIVCATCPLRAARCISQRGLKNVLWCAAVSKETFVYGKTSLLLRHRSLTVACPNPQTQIKTAYKTKEPFCGIPEVCGSVKRDL